MSQVLHKSQHHFIPLVPSCAATTTVINNDMSINHLHSNLFLDVSFQRRFDMGHKPCVMVSGLLSSTYMILLNPATLRRREDGTDRKGPGTSLVAQWLRIRLPVPETWVRALVWEDPTCHGATKPMCHNY